LAGIARHDDRGRQHRCIARDGPPGRRFVAPEAAATEIDAAQQCLGDEGDECHQQAGDNHSRRARHEAADQGQPCEELDAHHGRGDARHQQGRTIR